MGLENVIRAAQMAAIHEDIAHMPMQYETMVSEAGTAISGGQRQRLAIARALAHNPAVLLFDEATSHLDVLTETELEQNLRSMHCTRIIIAHRLSTVVDSDSILVMDDGKIVEQGTHADLLQRRTSYAQLIQRQITNGEIEANTTIEWDDITVPRKQKSSQSVGSRKTATHPLTIRTNPLPEVTRRLGTRPLPQLTPGLTTQPLPDLKKRSATQPLSDLRREPTTQPLSDLRRRSTTQTLPDLGGESVSERENVSDGKEA